MDEQPSELRCEESVEIDAVAHDVWAYRLDFAHLPAYNRSVRAVRLVDAGGRDGVGARWRFDLDGPGGTQLVQLTVTASEPGALVAVDLTGAVRARERFTIEGRRPCRATIALTVEIPDGLGGAAAGRLLAHGRAEISGELARMQSLLTQTPSGPTAP